MGGLLFNRRNWPGLQPSSTLYLASVLDLCGRWLLACPMSEHPDAQLASDAMKMAAVVRGGCAVIDDVIFHTDRGSSYFDLKNG